MKAFALTLAVLAVPATAQVPDRAKAQPISITMTDHGFEPRRIAVTRGGRYVLRITNRSGKGHNLTQKAFFANARVEPQDRRWIRDGQIVLDAGRRATVRLRAPTTRAGGTYQFSSTVLGDADDDYKGAFLIR